MAITERLALLITADAKGAITEFDKMGTAAEKNIGKAESKLDKFGSTMTSTGTKMIAGAAVIGAGMWQAGQSAADLEQAVGGTEAVFGAFTSTIDEFAAGAASAAGLSSRAARELTSGIGAILQGFGFTQDEAAKTSVELAQLGADLSATFGGKPEEAVSALGAALRGEFDPLERFGISMSAAKIEAEAMKLGLADASGEIDSQAKAQAALSLITQQSANAQGQFAREQGTTAGQMAITAAEFENAKAQLGEGFLPIMTKATQIGSGMIDMFVGLDSATGGMASTVVGASVPILGLGGVMAVGVGKAIEMREAFKGLAESGSKVGQWAAANSAALGGVGLALGAVAIGWSMYKAQQAEVRAAAQAMADTLDAQTGALTENSEVLMLNNLQQRNQLDDLDRAGVGMDEYAAAVSAGTRAQIDWHEISGAIGNNDNQINALRGRTDAMSMLIVKLHDAGELNRGLLDTLQDEAEAYDTANPQVLARAAVAERAAAMVGEHADATEDATDATEDQTAATKDAEKAWDDAEKALKKYLDGIDDFYDILDAGTNATMAWEASIDSQRKTIEDNGLAWNWVRGEIDLTTEAGRSVMKGYQDQRDVIVEAGKAVMENGGSVEEARAKMNKMTADLQKQSAAYGYTGEQVQWLTGELGLMPDQVQVIFSTPGAAEASATIANIAAQVANFAAAQAVVGNVAAAVTNAFSGGKPPGRRARGGPVDAGGAYIVGEEGPELMVMGSQGGNVIPADQTSRMLNGGGGGGGTTTVVLEVDGREFYRKVVKPQMQSDIQGNQGFGGR
jgi:hypothetical protein